MTHSMRQIINTIEQGFSMLKEGVSDEMIFDAALSPIDVKKCRLALSAAQHLLTAKGFGGLLKRIRFQVGPVMGEHGYYDRKADLVIIDAIHYDLAGVLDAILHELGHRLYYRNGFLLRAKAFWKFFDPQIRQNVGSYGKQNHAEMFAELFRNFMRNRVDAHVAQWLSRLGDQ